MNAKSVFRSFLAAIALIGPTASYADDTDIYISTNNNIQATPLVMLTLDMKANNLSAAFCSYDGSGTDDCFAKVGAEIYPFFAKAETEYGLDYAADGVTRFDAFRALHAALYEDLEGVEIGFMVSHNEQTANGGYVLRGFRPFLENDSNGAKKELLDKLYSIPNPKGATAGTGGGGGTGGGTGGTVGGTCTSTGGSDSMSVATHASNSLTFTVSDVAGNEGETPAFQIQVAGSIRRKNSVALNWLTASGPGADSATQGIDFTGANGTKTWTAPNGQDLAVNETITVPVALTAENPNVAEAVENFRFSISSAGQGARAVGSICDGAVSTGPTISVADASANAGANVTFVVSAAGTLAQNVTLGFSLVPGSAAAGFDYTVPSPLTVTIPAGTNPSASVSVATVADGDVNDETFELRLSSTGLPSGVTIADGVGVGTITSTVSGVCNDAGSYDHKYQGTELYFELFRYLTGGAVLSGHKGEGDWGSNKTTNLDTECYPPGGEGILKWDVGGPKPLDANNPYVEEKVGNAYRYISPLNDDQQCTGVYALNMMFGVSQQDNELNAQIGMDKEDGGVGQTVSSSNSFADMIQILGNMDLGDDSVSEWSYPDGAPDGIQKLTTYILRFDGPAGQFAPYAAAGANVIDADQDNLQVTLDILREIFRQILSVSTTFVSASVPVDVFNRASVNDNVFIALFTTDPDNKPSWVGNLKKLKLFELTQGGFILYDKTEADKNPTQAQPPISAIGTDGRIRYDSLTFWTEPAALPAPPTNPADYDEAKFMQTGKDGRFVARGAAGQKIPGFIASASSSAPGNPGQNNGSGYRKLFTEAEGPDGVDASADDLSEAVTDSKLAELSTSAAGALYVDMNVPEPGTDDDPYNNTPLVSTAYQLLCWARGLDDTDGDGDFCDNAAARSWIMGDALHSRPLPINYGDRDYVDADNPGAAWSKTNPDIRIVMGTNDGFLRMVQNTASTSGDEIGVENWGFMPRRLMKNLAILKGNNSATGHPYGVDGPITLLTDAGGDNNIRHEEGDRAWIYFGLRRGGDAIYAMDVSNPDSPALKWVIDSDTAGFDEMAMTFSTPVVGVVQYGGTKKEVVMFGAGYFGGGTGTSAREGYDAYLDNGTDTGAAVLSGDDGNGNTVSLIKGNAVYMVDADTGDLIWKASSSLTVDDNGNDVLPNGAVEYIAGGMTHSIAAPVTLVDTNGDSIDDRAYVPDMGGSVWRIDLPRSKTDKRASTWQAVKLASLGNGAAGGSSDRRFMDRIDFVPSQYPGSQSAFDALLMGSGDRAHPRDTSVTNYFFMIKDPNGSTLPGVDFTPITIGDLADANCFLNFQGYTPPSSCSTDDPQTQLQTGWKLEMEANGEKVLAPSVTVANEVFFTSYLPEGEPDAEGNPDPCQAGFEGTGRFYAVSLFNGYPIINQNLTDDSNNIIPSSKSDRFAQLKSKGIPSEIVPLGPGFFIRPDLQIGQTSGSSRFRTFWYEKGVD